MTTPKGPDKTQSKDGAKPQPARPQFQEPAVDLQPVGPAEALARATDPAGSPLGKADVVSLQRSIGNQAVQQLLAGRTATSTASPAVQLVDTGLSTRDSTKEYAKGAHKVKGEWAKLKPPERATKLVALCNAALAKVGAPPVTVALVVLKSAYGVFNARKWTIEVNKAPLEKDEVTDQEMARVVNTFYHEARHCEQYYRAARWMAGDGYEPKEISYELRIPLRISEAAKDQPLKAKGFFEARNLVKDAERKEAKEWLKNLGREGMRKYGKIIKELKAAQELEKQAIAAYKESPTEENNKKLKAARKILEAKVNAYLLEIIEYDAHWVGDKASWAYEEGSKKKGSTTDLGEIEM